MTLGSTVKKPGEIGKIMPYYQESLVDVLQFK